MLNMLKMIYVLRKEEARRSSKWMFIILSCAEIMSYGLLFFTDTVFIHCNSDSP